MPLTVPCLKCRRKFQVPSKQAGQLVRCEACGFTMVLPPLKRILAKKQLRAACQTKGKVPRADALPLELPEDTASFEPGATLAEELALECPHCAGLLCHDPVMAGQVVACPHCGGHLQMPQM